MAEASANQAQFLFKCGSLELDTFSVVNFEGTDRISTPYQFKIRLRSHRRDVTLQDTLNMQATLAVYRDDEYYCYSGVVWEFNHVETNTDFTTYEVTLVPRLRLLELTVQSRIFQKMDLQQIVRQVLDESSLSRYYTFDLQGSFPQREFVVQFEESDLNFISRLLEEAGVWYLFKEPCLTDVDDLAKASSESIVISNKAASFEFIQGDNDILYRTESGLVETIDTRNRECIDRLSRLGRVIPRQVTVKNYNYRTPEVNLASQMQVQGGTSGSVYHYGDEFKDTDGSQKYASVTANRIAATAIEISGTGNCRGFRAGFRFKAHEYEDDATMDTCLLATVTHKGTHASLDTGGFRATYSNTFSALPSSLIESFRPPLSARIPKLPGVITAPIEANGSDYAALDDAGRYKVRLPFDLSSKANYDATKYVRLAQPYSGSNYGIHFPSHEGAEMVLACVDGNPNRILGIGTVPNANTVSPVKSANKTQNIIRTAGANEILLEDEDGKQKITLKTAAVNAAEFDDENKRILIQSTDKNQLLLDDNNKKCIFSADKHNITMDYDKKKITITSGDGHVIEIDDDGKKITIQSKAGSTVQMDDNGKKVVLTDCKGKNTVTLDGSSGLMLESQGEIKIKATKDVSIEGANIAIKAATGKIETKATQDVKIEGMNIAAKATMDLKLEGMNTASKAQMQAKIEGGLGVEVKSNLQTKIGGTMTELSGSAMTTVKGAVVMIN